MSGQSTKICSFDGCGRPHKGHGLCHAHLKQKRATGVLVPINSTIRPRGSSPRLLYDEAPCPIAGLPGPCHIFRGHHRKDGYCHVRVGNRMIKGHRVALEAKHGPTPPGMEIDHQCRVRSCINPDHLRVVTKKVNRTENVVGANWQIQKAKTHCKRGHEFTPDNIYVNNGGRSCRQCVLDRGRARREAAG